MKNEFPKAPSLRKLIGPSFILLGLGLGSGEIILWPYLTSIYGLGIIWAAVIGISLQFFINMEIERYTLATGESVFVGLWKKYGKTAPFWYIFSTLIPWMWPGIIASSGVLISKVIKFNNPNMITIILLILMGVIYSLGSVIYKTQERLNKLIIFLGVPFIFILTFYLTNSHGLVSLAKGLMGVGNNFFLIPPGLAVASFLAAIAYAGAGGNLNLAQSYYIKEKGYGMGKFSEKLPGLFSKEEKTTNLEGKMFEKTEENLSRFKVWWKKINLEHLIVFLITGTLTILTLSLLSFTATFGESMGPGLNFIFLEASFITQNSNLIVSTTFLLALAVMLFGTQFAVTGSTSRIMAENSALLKSTKISSRLYSKYFFIFLWTQIFLGILVVLLGFSEPLALITIGAVLNAFSMGVYCFLILQLNKSLYKEIKTSVARKSIVGMAGIFYLILFTITILSKLK